MCHTKYHDFYGSLKTNGQVNRCKTTLKLPPSSHTDCKAPCSGSDRSDGASSYPNVGVPPTLNLVPMSLRVAPNPLCAGPAHSCVLLTGFLGGVCVALPAGSCILAAEEDAEQSSWELNSLWLSLSSTAAFGSTRGLCTVLGLLHHQNGQGHWRGEVKNGPTLLKQRLGQG